MAVALFRNARIFTPLDTGRPCAGRAQGSLAGWEKGALLCRDGRIVTVGEESSVLGGLRAGVLSSGAPGLVGRAVDEELDCGGRCMIPGFVDAHTHLCFVQPREKEFLARLEGADYLEILRAGGGILSSVASVRSATEEALFAATRARALSALGTGTTTIEMKSGYGLSLDAELKQLRVIRRVGLETPLTVVPTLLAAHAVPPEFAGRPDDYVKVVVETVRAAAGAGLAKYCDVFCEEGVFSPAQSRTILEAAAAAGLGTRLHADELSDSGGAALAASLRSASADHLLAASDAGLAAMAGAGVIAVLLPVTAFSMRKRYARARAMINAGVPVAVATDCNPGSSCVESMPFAYGLSVLQMGLTAAEALTATTLNGAYAIGLGAETGSLTAGKSADFLLLDGETPGILAFRTGISPVSAVFKRSVRVWPRSEP
jgi:imidazolonepropionase